MMNNFSTEKEIQTASIGSLANLASQGMPGHLVTEGHSSFNINVI
jgi:hypothetical protein